MYGDLSAAEIESVLRDHRYGRVAFNLNDEVYVIPMNYGYDGSRIYGQAAKGSAGRMPGGTKLAGMRQNSHVAFEVDEIQDAAHWRSVLVHGRFRELHDRGEKQAAFSQVVMQAGGGDRSEVSWGMDIDQLAVFAIDITARHGRFEQREAFDLRPLPKGPMPPTFRLQVANAPAHACRQSARCTALRRLGDAPWGTNGRGPCRLGPQPRAWPTTLGSPGR
jgi:uncharacterized protein